MDSRHLNYIDTQLTRERDYWTNQLRDCKGGPGLPLDFPRPVDSRRETETYRFAYDGEIAARLLEICQNKTTLAFGVLVASVKLCLFRYGATEDIVVGTAIHRRFSETAPLNKILLLRDHLQSHQTVREALAQVQQTLAQAYQHQKYPFQQLMKQLDVSATPNRTPLFDVAVLMEDINEPGHLGENKQDVTLWFSLKQGILACEVTYGSGLFEEATVALFGTHLQRLLGAMLADPEQEIGLLPMTSENKRSADLDGSDPTRVPDAEAVPVQAKFQAQARKTPGATALIFKDENLTYGELAQRVNLLARELRRRGVRPGVITGLYMHHGVELIVAILAVLEAGGAYLPMDPGNPAGRISFMLEDAHVPLVLVQGATADSFPGGAPTLSLDAPWSFVDEAHEPAETPPATLDDAAYLLYTSGSTGLPKGVLIHHRSLSNYVSWAAKTYLAGEARAFALYSSIAFDLTVTSVFTPLTTGNILLIYPQTKGEFSLDEVVRDNRVGVLKLTPSHLALMEKMDPRKTGLQCLILGGEALDGSLAHRIHRELGGTVAIYNEYGPTEATVACSAHRFDPATDTGAAVPIGNPADNCRVYLLDGRMQPVPRNAVGELYIAGMGVAQEYLNRPELTAERFGDDPFRPGERMYRTGDMARRTASGKLIFLGRRDDQVKFHGYRVELDEIRLQVKRFPKIRDCVVCLLKDHHQNDVMVAHYVSRQPVEVTALREFLSAGLLQEIIPNVFVHLKKLPLTLNGKVNRAALPSLAEAKERLQQRYVAPTTENERLLVDIWTQVLGVERVGIHSNFFEMGGHSLLANQVISRLPETFGVELPLRCMFESPTVAKLAKVLEHRRLEAENEDEMADLLAQVEQLSDEEVHNQITETQSKPGALQGL